MKTAMKRLLSFVLVAMMLVSVVPFQASADGDDLTFMLKGREPVVENVTIATDPGYTGDDPLTGDFYEYGSATPASAEQKKTLAGKTLYEVGYPISFSVTVKEAGGKDTLATFTYDAEIPVTKKGVKNAVAACDEVAAYDVDHVEVNLNKKIATVIIKAPTEPSTEPPTEPSTEPPTEPSTEPDDGEFTVTFLYCDRENCRHCDEKGDCASVTRTTKNQRLRSVDLPSIPLRYGYTFSYWKNITNRSDEQPQDMRYTSDVTFMAIYKEDADSNLHKVKVYGVTYNDGKTNVLSKSLVTMYVEDEADLLTALRSKASAIQDELDARGYSQENKYTWDGYTFYDDSDLGSDDKVASGTEVTGDGIYYIKVKYTGNNKVQLYIHTSKTLTIKDTVTLTTYAPGETISQSQIASAVKNAGWSYGTLRTYTRDAWEKIVDRDSSSAADETKSFTVSKGETEIHVYLTGASGSSSSSSSNKSDNPKTGDTILMAVTVMGLSASALAAVYFVSKKKQSL